MRRSCTKCGVCRASRSPTTRSFSRTETVMQADPGQEREALLEEALRWALTAIENMAGEAKEWPAFDKARAALAAREEPPDARVTVGQSRIGPVGDRKSTRLNSSHLGIS